MSYGTACRAQHLSTVDSKLPRSSVIDITSDDKCFSLEELHVFCLIVCLVGLFVCFPSIVLHMLQSGINALSDHPCFEALVVCSTPLFMLLVMHTSSVFSGAPVTDCSRRNLLHFLDEK